MTEARHEHAVSLLTAATPTIALLLEREAGGALLPSPLPQSPSPSAAAANNASPVFTASPGEPGPLHLSPSLLAATLEGPYPVEVSAPEFRSPAAHQPSPRVAARPGPPVLRKPFLGLLGIPRRSACRDPGARWGSASWEAPTTPATPLESRNLGCSSPR